MTREDALKEFIRLYGEAERGQVLINKIYDDFEEKIDKAIIEAEDSGWYEYDDKNTCIELLYQLKDNQ